MSKKQAIVKAGFFAGAGGLSIDNARRRSVQKLVPIIPASRLVTGIANERINLRGI
jgi:hypothetical protein